MKKVQRSSKAQDPKLSTTISSKVDTECDEIIIFSWEFDKRVE